MSLSISSNDNLENTCVRTVWDLIYKYDRKGGVKGPIRLYAEIAMARKTFIGLYQMNMLIDIA